MALGTDQGLLHIVLRGLQFGQERQCASGILTGGCDRRHLVTDRAAAFPCHCGSMWSGWTVHVWDAARAGDDSTAETYYANVSDRADAVQAVKDHIGATSSHRLEARKPIQSTVFAVMSIGIGKVGQA